MWPELTSTSWSRSSRGSTNGGASGRHACLVSLINGVRGRPALRGALDLSTWPERTRAISGGEIPHPGAQLSFTDVNGYRFQVFITDQPDADIAYLEARHRGHARVEDRIRCGKDTGLRNLPFHDFAANAVWLQLVLMAIDLLAWTQGLTLAGEAQRWEPKRLRYALLHVAARVCRSGRRLHLRLQHGWRWSVLLCVAFQRLRRLPIAL